MPPPPVTTHMHISPQLGYTPRAFTSDEGGAFTPLALLGGANNAKSNAPYHCTKAAMRFPLLAKILLGTGILTLVTLGWAIARILGSTRRRLRAE